MKKNISFLLLLVLSVLLSSCGNTTKLEDASKNKEQMNKTNITGNNTETDISVKELMGDKDKNVGGKNIAISDKEDHNISSKQEQLESRFASLPRNKQIEKVKNINCEKTFKTDSARKECMNAKGDIIFASFIRLTDKEKANFDCNKLKINNPKYPDLKVLYIRCVDAKVDAIKELERKRLSEKKAKGDLSYCGEKTVIAKKGFNLDMCKISVIAKSGKDCSVLDTKLQNKCKNLKSLIREQKRESEIKKERKRKEMEKKRLLYESNNY